MMLTNFHRDYSEQHSRLLSRCEITTVCFIMIQANISNILITFKKCFFLFKNVKLGKRLSFG